MKKITILFCIIILSTVSTKYFSQDNSMQFHKTMFSFEMSDVQDKAQLESIQDKMEAMKHVEKVKLNYKTEKPNMGQLIIYVKEPVSKEEKQQEFNPIPLKKMIIENGITLLDTKVSKY